MIEWDESDDAINEDEGILYREDLEEALHKVNDSAPLGMSLAADRLGGEHPQGMVDALEGE